MKTLLICLALAALSALPTRAQDDDLSVLSFVVIRDYNGKPVRNASVVMHPVNKKGKQERGGFQLKTDADGKTSFDGVPYGKLRVQVLAEGFQTFGEDYEVNTPAMEITVRMKRPAGQYSIYDNQSSNTKDDKKDQSKPPSAPEKDTKPQ